MAHFGFAIKMGTRTLNKSRLNFSKCNPSPSLPFATTESSKQSQCSYLVLGKQTSLLFLSARAPLKRDRAPLKRNRAPLKSNCVT